MRSFVPAAMAAAALLAAPAHAQDAGPGASVPEHPIPYTALAPKPHLQPKSNPIPGVGTPARAPATEPAVKAARAQAPATPSPDTSAAPATAPVVPETRRSPGARLAPGQALPAGELETFVDGVVTQAMARQHIAGVSVAVVQNGQILLKKGYGFASLAPQRPVDPDRTLFRLGPVSSTFTWIGLMKQVEAGRIRLDQPVNLYLPTRVRVRDQGFDSPIRVLDLMDHAAGLEDRAFHLYERDPDYVRPLELYLRQERPRRVRAPGAVSTYSNYGAALAGEATAQVSGKPFERLMEEQIFMPLGMNHTTFREPRPAKAALPAPMPEGLAANVAEGFRWTPSGFKPRPYEYLGQIAPAASASSTAGDMARYMLALLGGGQLGEVSVYGPRTAQAFRTQIVTTPPGVNGWAHGFMVAPLPGGRTGYGHAGATLSFVSNFVTAPELNLGVFIAANTDSGAGLSESLPQAIVREFYAAAEPFPRSGASELASEPGLYSGHYLSTRRAYSGLQGFVGLLTGAAHVRISDEGRLVTDDGAGPKVWVPEAPLAEGRFVGLQDEERLAFRLAGGQAAAFRTSPDTQLFERVSFWRSPAALCLTGALTAAAAVLSLLGAALRSRRELRENLVQGRAALVQNIQGGLWLTAMAAFGVWAVKILADPARLAFRWPGPMLVTASACGLVAAALTVTTIVALPAVWRGGRRVDSWPILRRFSFTVTILIYAVFSFLLARAGALSPWSG